MSGKFPRVLSLLVLVIIAPLGAFGLQYGQDPESVIWEIGEPNGKRQLTTGEIWVYSGDIRLEFEDGRLVRAVGIEMDPFIPEEAEPEPAATPEPEKPSPDSEKPSADSRPPAVEPAPEAERDELSDDALLEMADSISNPESYRKAVDELQEEFEAPPESRTLLQSILGIAVPTALQWIFLIIAFKVVGAEALKSALLLIAFIDRLVILGVQWVFFSLLTYPTTFHADTLLSFIVMIGLVTTLTHARQLPTAIKVVVASKIAGFVAGYLFLLFLLHNL